MREIFKDMSLKSERKRLFAGLVGRQEQIFMFLTVKDVPYDNNGSERALRNSVIRRKIAGYFRSEFGADYQT